MAESKDKPTIGGLIGSAFFPFFGGIAYFRIKDEYPKSARAYGLVAVISFVLIVFGSMYRSMGGGEGSLGKVKGKKGKEPKDDKQQKIDFTKPETEKPSTKIEAVRQVRNLLVKQEGALIRAEREPDNPRYKDLASQYHAQAQKQNGYLNINYDQLKGAKCFRGTPLLK